MMMLIVYSDDPNDPYRYNNLVLKAFCQPVM